MLKYGAGAFIALYFLLPNVSFAATREELQQQLIVLLMQQIEVLQAQLASMKAADTPPKKEVGVATPRVSEPLEDVEARCSDELTYITGGNLKERRVQLCYSDTPGALPYFHISPTQWCHVQKGSDGTARLESCASGG